MKKILCLLSAIMILLCMVACGNDKEERAEKPTPVEEQTTEVDVNSLLMPMREALVGFPQYTTASSHDENGKVIEGWEDVFMLSLYDGFDVSKVKSYAIAYSTVQTADEITVVVLESKKDTDELKKQMRARVSDRITLFETYGPTEVSKLQNAKVISKDNVCALVISDQPEKAEEAFNNELK